ncbi:TspO/MBR family protein [Colletotrichum truncatum]|uniref:TspO/MBR family protein n=1 Tax=Colletotrichum truncatum TaxID=5467 RepID=A0ACC3Z2P5_COLTU|nr:TspO/MBR family protein [Colletotrichum truncatum]KAF6793306.1 TspO/MBR family protein [Colletotrichum truncatum]
MTTYIPSITIPTAVFQSPAASILLPVTLGLAVGYSTGRSQTQNTYRSLRLPPLRPPPWIFAPVWTVLYGLMGYSAYRATTTGLSLLASPEQAASAKQGMTLYTLQLVLNLVWQPLFFSANRPKEATVDIIALLGLNGYLTYVWSSVDEVSAWCQVPYLAWLSFATYLSAGTGYLNNWDLKSGATKKNL